MKQHHVEVIDRVYAGILAARTPGERAAMISDAHRAARVFMAAGERIRHPEWTDEQVAEAVTQRLLHGPN